MEESLQVHVFASLYTFSDAARGELSSKYSNDEASTTAAFNLFGGYIESEKLNAPDPYEVTKLERLPETVTKKTKLATSDPKKQDPDFFVDPYQVQAIQDSSNVLMPHDTISKVWTFAAVKTTPRRLLRTIEYIARNTMTEAGLINVKGDNEKDLSETLGKLDDFARVLVLRQGLPQVYNLVIPEQGAEVRFKLTPLEDHDANDHRSTTMIDQRLLGPGFQAPRLAVILKVTNTGAILTCSRFRNMLPYQDTAWHYPSIPSYGNQQIDVEALISKYPTAGSQTRSVLNHASQPQLASIAEWIAAIGKDAPKSISPTKDISWDSSKSDNVDATTQPKRFGKTRKMPELVDIDEMDDNSSIDGPPSEAAPTDNNKIQSLKAPEYPTQLASSTSKTPSSGSPKSPAVDTSSKPSTQSTTDSDLIMSAEPAIAIPAMIPIQASVPTVRSQAGSTQSKTAPPPAWVHRSVSSQAENKKPGLLVDCVERQKPLSYVAAAKRGTNTRGRGSSRGLANIQGGAAFGSSSYRSQPAKSVEEAKPVEWISPTSFSKARKASSKGASPASRPVQRTATSSGRRDNDESSQPDHLAIIQILEQASSLRGDSVTVEVEIGRILIKSDSESGRLANIYNAWSSVFGKGAGDELKTETIFTDRLPNPHINLGFPSNLKQTGGQQIFADIPFNRSVKYRFLCTTVRGDEEVVLDVTQSGHVQALSPEYVAGAFQFHFPQRQWDARLVFKTSERINYYEDAVKAVGSSLSVIPSLDQATASVYTDLGNSGLLFKSAMILRQAQFQCIADPDISMTCTEAQYLGAARDQRFFHGSIMDRAAAEAKGDIWWEVKLNSKKLQQGTNEEVVQSGIVQRLQAVAIEVVTQIDTIGAYIKQVEAPLRTAATESLKLPKVVAFNEALAREFVMGGMVAPPAKRRKKLVVLSSEDEDEEPAPESNRPQVLPTRLRSKAKPVTRPPPITAVKPTNQPKPPKPAIKQNDNPKNPRPSSLNTYFNAGHYASAGPRSTSQTPKISTAGDEEDFIEDDSFDEELQKLSIPRQDLHKVPTNSHVQEPSPRTVVSSSRVFRKLGNGIEKSEKKNKDAVKPLDEDTRPWADRYGPLSLEELAVHKKKVADVRDWLYSVFQGRSKKRVLILKGASGVGKTATVSILSKALEFDLIEWANPTVSDYSSDNYVSTTALFEEFLRRSGKFTSLDIISQSGLPDTSIAPDSKPGGRKKVILVEEFPNLFMTSTNALQSFRSSILQHLASNTPREAVMPLIMIITESQTTGTTSLTDTLTAHRLLGPAILNHPFTDTIEFNPIAPTFITKALNVVLQKEARHSGRRRIPGPSVLKRLSSSGDVRSAIGSLEFLCLKRQDADDWSGRVAAKGIKKGGKTSGAIITEMEEESLELVTRREVNLGLFHAVGKVVYNKREGVLTDSSSKTTQEDPPTQPPRHLPQHARLKPPDVDVDTLMDETGTDTSTFVASLHENYVLSCHGDRFLDTANECVEALSDSDILLSGIGRGGSARFKGNGGGTGGIGGMDGIRQDEMAWHVAVRGLLFGLPCPVKRGGLPSGSAGGRMKGKEDAFKMFYPMSLRLGKGMLEVEEGVERCVERMRNGPHSNAGAGRVAGEDIKMDEVASWSRRTMFITSKSAGTEELAPDTPEIGACGIPNQDDLVREVFPYLSIISHHHPHPLLTTEELNTITKISASIPATTEESLDELDMADQTTGLLTSAPVPKRDGIGGGKGKDPSAALAVEQAVGRLYLSDDDIED
ncbi:MAG: hypothetical protein Q9168_002572 [Polycauliona sp. 1 TL-2023]